MPQQMQDLAIARKLTPKHNGDEAIFGYKSSLYKGDRGFSVSLHATIAMLTQIALALIAIHDAGCIHGNIKLKNIMLNYTPTNGAEYVMVKVIDSELSKKVDENFKNRSTCSALSLEPNINPSTDMWGLGLITLPILFGKVAQNEYNRMGKSRYIKQAKNQTAEERRQHISDLFHGFNNTMEVTTGLQYPPEVLRPLIDLESRLLSLDSRQRPTAEETLKILTKLLVSPWPERPSPQVSLSTFTL